VHGVWPDHRMVSGWPCTGGDGSKVNCDMLGR
jgi:hypothetical protein